jgi:uncharacterized protein (TIGR03663 family)
LLLVSLLLRFWQVAERPLDPAETRTAIASLAVARGGRFPSEAGALLGFGDALVFAIVGATDGTARFLPALLGGLIPLGLIPARRLIGRATALLAAVLLTFSPLLIDQARTVGSAAIAATLSLALVFTLFAYVSFRQPRYLNWSAVLLALTLTSGAPAFATLVALGTFGIYMLAIGRSRDRLPGDLDAALLAIAPANGRTPSAGEPDAAEHHGRDSVLIAIGLFLGTLGLVATGALIDPGGVAAGLFAPLGSWLGAFRIGATATPLWMGPLMLLAYEPLVLVFGVAGAVLALRAPRRLDQFLVWWLIVGLLAALASPDRSAALLAPALLPACVLSAAVLQRLLARVWPGQVVAYLVALATLTWVGALGVVGWGQASLPDAVGVRVIAGSVAGFGEDSVRLVMGVLPLIILAIAVAYLWTRLGPAARPAIGLAAATLLFAATLHAGWNLAYQVVGNVSELPHREQTTVDVRSLADDVDEVTQVLTINRKDKNLVIIDSLRYPLAWYLRDGDVRFDSRVAATPAMAILPLDAKAPSARYGGQRYGVTMSSAASFENLAQLWRWIVYRESAAPIDRTDVNLFVRAQ